MTTITAAARPVPWWRRVGRPGIVFAIVIGWIVLGSVLRGRDTLSLPTQDTTPLHDRFTAVRDWVDVNRNSNPFFTGFVDGIRDVVGGLTTFLQDLISHAAFGRPVPLIGWLGVIALATFGAYAFGNARVAVLTAAGFTSLGLLGLWQESMDTLALTVAAVLLSLMIGIPLGVYVGLSRAAERVVTPVLDTMQAMPTLVYLAPLTLFFLIGPPAAVIATLIYALPPVLRLTALGIRQVNEASTEASRSLGATRWQILRQVQLPLAKRTIVVGINQTTMAAFSMVMIAALIAGPGLGQVVLRGLTALDVGRAFTGGLGIVILAIVLDRVTTAASERAEASYRSGARERTHRIRRWLLIGGGAVTAVAVYLSASRLWASIFPGPARGGVIGFTIDDAVNAAADWTRLNLNDVTSTITAIVSYGLINPLQALIAESPWYVVCAVVLGLTWTLAGARSLIVASVCLALLLASGLWESAMVTLTSVLVATIIVVAMGVVLGVVLARSRRADVVVRPILDAAQVLPAFVYLVPFVGLFGPTRLTAIIAAVVYAAPVVIKIVADGVRAVPAAAVEAGIASGSSRWQIVTKVQLPLSRQAVTVAANQGLIYVLSVVVIGGLVGAGALGYLVVAGFSQSELFGKGLAAGIAIVVLGILLDRVTQAAARRAQAKERRLPGDTEVNIDPRSTGLLPASGLPVAQPGRVV
jgi:glycine betaine/proline transport system permease protein